MEGTNSVASDFKTRVAQIAAAGNKPEDWKEYIDMIKVRAQSMDDYKRNRLITYVYFNAFKMIPDTDRSLGHAILLKDYAEFKSIQDLDDAEKLLSYGRRNLRQFAIIHVASAELELKRGNKEKAVRILQRATSLGAEPASTINLAFLRLTEGKTQLLTESAHEGDTDHSASPSSGKDSSGEYSSSQISGTFGEGLGQSLPGCRLNTQEVQNELNILTRHHFPVPVASASVTESACVEQKPKDQQKDECPLTSENSGLPHHMKTPEPPKLLSIKYLDLMRDSSSYDSSVRQSALSIGSQFQVPETPQNHHLESSINTGSSKGVSLFQCTPNIRQTVGSNIKSSGSKFRALSLGLPRRVKINPALRKLRDEEEDTDSQDITTSELLHSLPKQTGETQSSYPTSSVSEQANSESYSEMLKDISNTKNTDKNASFSASTFNQLPQFPVKISSVTYVSNQPSVAQSQLDGSGAFSSHNQGQFKITERKMIGDLSNTNESSSSNTVQAALPSEHSRKFSQTSIESVNFMKKSVPQMMSGHRLSECGQSSDVRLTNQESKEESTKEILAKQQEMIQQQQQIVQQLVQQQKQQQEIYSGSRMYSAPDQQSVIASYSVPTKPPMSSGGQKMIYVNGKPYNVMRQVGRGGSAKVYQVYNPESNTVLALKCVSLACANQVIVEGYKNEINLLRKLQHCDLVIRLYDFEYVEASKKLLAVLEYGETDLCKFISHNEKNQQTLHPITVCYFWFQMVTAVHAMHKEGVIHSDLKPANFILVSGQVKLIDFGIANSLQQDNTSILKENMVGTPSYMSPEALMAINSDPSDPRPRYKVGVRSDVWSLGCILYQMVYGHTPFQHIRQKLEAIINPAHEIPFPDKGNPALMDVLKKCLTRNVQMRPTSDELLNHPYLQKHSEAQIAIPSLDSRLHLLESALSGASPRTQLALRKRCMELVQSIDGRPSQT